jgi:hypothetical protein
LGYFPGLMLTAETIGFDAQHHASIKKVSKTKTLVE